MLIRLSALWMIQRSGQVLKQSPLVFCGILQGEAGDGDKEHDWELVSRPQ